MKFRAPLCLLMIALPLALVVAEETPAVNPAATPAASPTPGEKKKKTDVVATPKPTILKKWMHALGIPVTTAGMKNTGYKGLDIGIKTDPTEVQVSQTKDLKVTVTLINHGKKITQLDFPTSQRIEVLVKAKDGKMIEQWSEDQAFDNEPSLVTVNPGERLEYVVKLSTRDMVAGETYSVEAFFPNFEQLRTAVSVAAVAAPAATPGKSGAATPAKGETPPPADAIKKPKLRGGPPG